MKNVPTTKGRDMSGLYGYLPNYLDSLYAINAACLGSLTAQVLVKDPCGRDSDLSPKAIPIEETPVVRAKQLLSDLEISFRHNKPCGDRSRALEKLAAMSTEVQDELWKSLVEGSQPQLRWLAMEILATHQWAKLSPFLVHELQNWDWKKDRAVWLGAVVTIRQHPVSNELRSLVADALRSSLDLSTESARAGHDVEQTEVVCETIDTFRSFAEPLDLVRLRQFWQSDCTFTVQLRAFDAASMVARRFPNDDRTNSFFAQECEYLTERFCDLARERMVAIENGALLWRVAGLLVARLGDEARGILPATVKHRFLVSKLRRLVRDAELNLIRNQRKAWLAQRRSFVQSLKEELAHAENQ